MGANFRLYGHLYPLKKAAELMEAGQRVAINDNGDLIKCPEGEKGFGWSRVYVEDHGKTGYDILQSTVGYSNPNRGGDIARLGDPIGVAIGGEVVMDEYSLFTGTVEAQDFLTVGPSGLLETTANRDDAVAIALSSGNASNGDRIEIKGLD